MTITPAPLRLVFLGCGYITGVHSRHLRRLRALFSPGYASRDRGKADAFAARYGGRAYGDYASAIDDPDVDAVVVAVPPKWHLELTLQALAAGKHVLVEKPAFPQLADYATVRDARDRAQRVVLIGENDHYKPLAVYLRRQLAAGVIGDLVFGSFTTIAHRLKSADDWRNDETMAGGDAFFEEGIHWLHLAGSLGPSITHIRGFRPAPGGDGPDRRVKSMLVAFDYDSGAVGTLLYSREVPSLFRGLRLSKLFGRRGVISFESNGTLALTRGTGLPRLACPGLRDIRGYRAMYRDFAGSIRAGGAPEMSLERAAADHRLMADVYESLARTGPSVACTAVTGDSGDARHVRTGRFDVVIIGTGAGGGTMLHALAGSGARILAIERGDFVPQEDANWDPAVVWKDLRYRTTEQWLDAEGRPFVPYTHYGVGGNSKFWGSVLYRLRREDFSELRHADGVSPAWPIGYDTLAPYYDQAERLFHVHGEVGDDPTEPPRAPYPYPPVPHAPRMAAIVRDLRALGLHPSPLPLGLIRPGESGGCRLCNTCNSFPCRIDAKSDADVLCVRPAMTQPTVTLWTGARATRLVTSGSGSRVEAVEIERGGAVHRIEAGLVIVACGAVNSAALLLRSAGGAHPHGVANSSDLVGRRYMAHLATMLEGVHWRKNHDEFQKTLAINDFYLTSRDGYPLGQIQSQGRTHAVMAKVTGDSWVYKGLEMRHIPLCSNQEWVSRATDWLAMTEDLPDSNNRVHLAANGRIVLDYRPNNTRAHTRLVETLRDILGRLGYWSPRMFAHSAGAKNTTHQCGTLVFGTDPKASVLDPFCRTHDVENLFVVDASFFPSSAAVNPALTIVAQALRVAEHIRRTDLKH